jgi:hypothetical protein
LLLIAKESEKSLPAMTPAEAIYWRALAFIDRHLSDADLAPDERPLTPYLFLFAALSVGGWVCLYASGAPGNLHCAYVAAVVFRHCLLDSALTQGTGFRDDSDESIGGHLRRLVGI